jgi:chromosome segregation protein
MKIRQLELKGFKSFKNRTVIRFGKGASGIVGPNGCGKSNIIDAFLWVMGETAPKHLRGSSMEDVIFSGTGRHPASGVAEVSLIMELEDTLESKKQEIMLTRRLDRDGKSEYLINSKPCRLKDVHEVFMDTGAGVHGFSFIEQGAVEQFILSKPEQKRILIESAAGISKFRSRKREAERKLDLTEINLKRLRDILSQQENQLKKLKKQSEKAEQFRDIKERIREKDIRISSRDLKCVQKEKQFLDKQIDDENKKSGDMKKEVDQKGVRSDELKRLYEHHKTKSVKAETEMQSIRNKFLSLDKELVGLKASIQVNKQNLSPQDAQSYKQNRQAILSQIDKSEKQIYELEKKQKSFNEQWKRIKKEHEKVSESCSSAEIRRQSLETELVKCAHQEALSQERNQSIFEMIKDGDQSEKEWKSVLQVKSGEVQKLRSQKKKLDEKLEKEKQLNFSVTDSVQQLQAGVDSFKKDIQFQESRLKEEKEKASVFYSEWDSLKKIGSRMDTQEKGLRFILNVAEKKEDFIETAASVRLLSPVLEKAVSSYLDMRLKSVFCRDEQAMLSAVTLLKQKRKGRCRFILPAKQAGAPRLFSSGVMAPSSALSKKVQKEPGFKFFLRDKVEGDRELIDLLFSNTAVVEEVNVALRLKSKYAGWCFLTLAGEVVTPEGDLIGGELVQEEMNILTYRRAMKEMPVQYERMKKKVELMEAQLKKTKTLFQKSENQLSELNRQEGDFQIRILEINKDLESVTRDQDRLASEVSEIQKKILEYQKKRQEWQKKRDQIQDEITSSTRQNALTLELKKAEGDYKKQREEKHLLSGQKDQIWMKMTTCEKELAMVREKMILLNQSLEDEEQKEKKILSYSLEKKVLIQNYEKQLEEKEREKKIFDQKVRNKESQINSLVEEQENIREQINKEQTAIIDLHKTLTEKESVINELKLQAESLSLRKSALIERIMEKYQIDLESVEDSRIFPDEKEGFSFNRDDEEKELQKLTNRLVSVGEVNLLALKEYEEVSKENDFYQKQYEDLCIAKEKLDQVIKRIDSFCTSRFKEVFEEVNSCFSKVWPSLFEGGKAEMILTRDPEKGVEGIDIMVQPPGKKVQNMSLLSGGEKAMTAVAVIFSIFLVKPSPFCILDEVDAPLDDVNVVRFNSLLEEMAAVSQMIVITHNKYTMKGCSRLYGVTMEEKGVSKVMSLDMGSARHVATSI